MKNDPKFCAQIYDYELKYAHFLCYTQAQMTMITKKELNH